MNAFLLPSVRLQSAIAWIVLVMLLHRPAALLLCAIVSVILAVRAGWRQGGGPPVWSLGLMFGLPMLGFSVGWESGWVWKADGWISGIPVGLRLISISSISVWLMAKVPPLRLADAFGRISKNRPEAHWPISLAIAVSSAGWMRLESERIALVHRARSDTNFVRLRDRLVRFEQLLMILLTSSIRRADQVSIALYCRGWRGGSIAMQEETQASNRWLILAIWSVALALGLWDRLT